jgi:hypothetical protein
MGSIWLHNLPDVLEGLDFRLYSGWENRSRSSGGYNALMGIVVHHTASNTSTSSDTNYMWNNSPDKPVGAIYLARDGEIVVGAAGATNCAGKGGPYSTSKGTIPLDSGNSNTINIEAGNAGTGEQWPTVQQDAYVALVAALCRGYDLDPTRDVLSHFEWAPDRKIDPAGNSRYASGGNKWNMDKFRSDVKAKLAPPPPEEEEVTEAEMDKIAQKAAAAVMKYMTTDLTVNKPVTFEYLMQCTRGAACNADRQSRPGDAKNVVNKEVWGKGTRTLTG